MVKTVKVSLERGQNVIKEVCKTLGNEPGVYRMLNDNGDVLYVGKARALRKRVFNYTNINKLPGRIQRMVAETSRMEIVQTGSEVEALLLESNLIKKLKPRYNILLRDDKSFPYIWLTSAHDFPRLVKYRGSKKEKGDFYGPFASAGAVNRTIAILQRAFLLRNCTDSMFESRKRPCLQYHIKRCTAPCVGYVDKEEYKEQVQEAEDFLEGQSRKIQKRYQDRMDEASKSLNYEEAAKYRDRLRALMAIHSKQSINVSEVKDADVHAISMEKGKSCIQVFFFRGGQNFGNRSYFPRHTPDAEPRDILGAFLVQFYENKPIPSLVLVNETPTDRPLIAEALGQRKGGRVEVSTPTRGTRKKLVDFVQMNARKSLARNVAQVQDEEEILEKLVELFDLNEVPRRIEVYDNSHISGTNMVGAMIVAGPEGLRKNAYRKFNIREAAASDDFAMMREVIKRRFRGAREKLDAGDTEDWPSLLLIDGGKGQLSSVLEILEELEIVDELNVVAISKGPDRNAGREQFHQSGKETFQLPVNDSVLHYLQRLRDEAHRFAISAHRARRGKVLSQSGLDKVPGVGAKRKKALLHHFGSAKAVERASVDDLVTVKGVSRSMAEKIHGYFQGES